MTSGFALAGLGVCLLKGQPLPASCKPTSYVLDIFLGTGKEVATACDMHRGGGRVTFCCKVHASLMLGEHVEYYFSRNV
jgi:hypothetical protein